jgi:hypothetical protein
MSIQTFSNTLDISDAVEATVEQVILSGQVPQIVIHYHCYAPVSVTPNGRHR